MLKLPDLIKLNDYGGDWDKYLNVIYQIFVNDFIKTKPKFQNQNLQLKRHPLFQDKEATFWHFITEGKSEEQRLPDMRRCERIGWPRPIIENSNDESIKIWENTRKKETRICLCYGNWEYLVVLSKRKNYILPWTAYPITRSHAKNKIIREYNKYIQQTKTAPINGDGIVTPSTTWWMS